MGQQDPLAGVEDVFNAILVKGDATGDVMFYGRGAGKLPTASAVVADVIAAARQLERASYRPWSPNRPEAVVSPEPWPPSGMSAWRRGTLEGERLTIPGAAEGESGWLTPRHDPARAGAAAGRQSGAGRHPGVGLTVSPPGT